MAAARLPGAGLFFEGRFRRRNGEVRWAAFKGESVPGAPGAPRRLLGTARDITERKQREIELRDSEIYTRGLLESSPDCVTVMRPDGRLEFMNANGRRLMEIDDAASLAGQAWESLWPVETRLAAREAIDRAAKGLEHRFEAACPTAKGAPKVWDVVVTPALDSTGRATRVIAASRDISDRKAQEDHVKVLMGEINHRAKNLLGVVQAIATQTARGAKPADFVRRFS